MANKFLGKVILDPYKSAMLAAQTGSCSPFNLFSQSYFVDGAHSPAQTSYAHYKPAASGAGVVYKSDYNPNFFTYGAFPVPDGDAVTAELTALAEGLEIALNETIRLRQGNMAFFTELLKSQGQQKIFIFSDCKDALDLVSHRRSLAASKDTPDIVGGKTRSGETRLWHESDEVMLQRMIVASQKLRAIPGLRVEVRWTPGHSGIPGNEFADQAAKSAKDIFSQPWCAKVEPMV